MEERLLKRIYDSLKDSGMENVRSVAAIDPEEEKGNFRHADNTKYFTIALGGKDDYGKEARIKVPYIAGSDEYEKEDVFEQQMEVVKKCIQCFYDIKLPPDLCSKEFILQHVFPCFRSTATLTKEILDTIPHKYFLDLTVIFRAIFNQEMCRMTVTENMMELLDISLEELEASALDNIEKNTKIIGLNALLNNFSGIYDEVEETLYAVCSCNNNIGITAGSILCRKRMEEASKIIGGDFYIIPSSIYEILIVPASVCNAASLREIIHDVNNNCVEEDDRLSYNVYYYEASTGEITIR